ncbi:hypothetical protein AB0K62_27335 [Streptomyces halstedii]|uniref:hypothetical protein n=1 Tax=Streptomyces halstedii TaxID=1944 RepID=UPI00345FB8B1
MEQSVELAVIKKLGHAHIGVTATLCAHVRLRHQHQAIDALSHALGDQDDDPPSVALAPLLCVMELQ